MRVSARWMVVFVAALVACGSTLVVTSGAGAAAPAAQGIDGNTIKIGGVFDNLSFAGSEDGFTARIERANKSKELGKYTIDYIGSTDVGGDPDRTLSSTQNLIEREGVFAVAPVVTAGFQQTSATYAAGKQVPYFGAGFTPAFCKPNTYGFSVLGCAVSGQYVYTTSVVAVAESLGKKVSDLKWALPGLAIPDGPTTVDRFEKEIKAEGGKVVYAEASIPRGGGGDLQPIVSAVMDAKPDVVWTLAAAEVLGFTAAMKAAGYTGAMANSAFYSPGLLTKIPAIGQVLEGSYIAATTPVLESDSAYVKQMEKDYAAIGKSEAITFGGLYSYMSADLMVATMKKVAPNFDKLAQTIGKSFSYKPAKDGSPVTWPAAFNSAGSCNTVVQVVSGEYKITTPYTCDGKRISVN